MLNVIWSLKACMLLMFARMTSGTTHIKWIKIVAVYVVIGWVAVQIAFFTACIPFSGYWAVPVSNPQCTTLEHFAIVQATFNLSSDVLIIAVPIPMVISLTLPTKQKIGLGVLFIMGTFVVSMILEESLLPFADTTDRSSLLFLLKFTTFLTFTIRPTCFGIHGKLQWLSTSPTYRAFGRSCVSTFASYVIIPTRTLLDSPGCHGMATTPITGTFRSLSAVIYATR